MEAEITTEKTDDHCMAIEEPKIMRRSRSDPVALHQSQVGTSDTSRIETLQIVSKRARTHIFDRCPSGHFQHEPLENPKKQIRLVRLLPGGSDEIIRLECRSWWLEDEDMPSYNAISYTWGDVQTQLLFVNGETLHVRKNCYYALWQAGLHFPGEWAWIDSICIDQSNDDEKSFQVQMMFNIYSSADLVLSCVGPHADNSELLVEATHEVLELLLKDEQIDEDAYTFDYMEWAYARDEAFFIALRKSYEKFSERSYWTRLWVIQEMRAPGHSGHRALQILCGCDSIELWSLTAMDHFYNLRLKGIVETLKWAQISTSTLYDNALCSMLAVLAEDEIRLGTSLIMSLDFHCSDPRDKLYGLLSLITWSDEFEPIKPDYSKSSWDIFLEVAPLLDPWHIHKALAALQIGISTTDLVYLSKRRALVDCLRLSTNDVLSESAKQLGFGETPKHSIPLSSQPPLAMSIQKCQLKPLPQDISHVLLADARKFLENKSQSVLKASDIAPCLPVGIFVGSDLVALVDRKSRP